LTIDAEGDITLDANGADIILSDDSTEFGRFKRDNSDFVIKSATNNKDIVFRGVDNSATITALTLDMGEAGAALFNSSVSGSEIIASSYFVDKNSGPLLRIEKDAWTTATDHDILYNGWQSSTDDYIYLKVGGNSTSNHGIIAVTDNAGFLVGNTNDETGAVLDNTAGTFGLDRLDFRVDKAGNVTASGTVKATTFEGDGSAITNTTAVSSSAQINSLINDTIAATIVAEIDNDEIPIAKLAQDAITIGGAGSTALGGTATVANILKGSSAVSSSTQINGLINDTIAATIVAEIDNDEIPIAKLAEHTIQVTAGTNLSGGGTMELGEAVTLNVDDAFLKNDADDTTSGVITAAGYLTNGNISATHITGSGQILANSLSGSTVSATNGTISNDLDIGNDLNVTGDIRIGQTNSIGNASQIGTNIQFNSGQMLFDCNSVELMRLSSTSGVVFNVTGQNALDFTIEGDSDQALFFVDSGADKIAIGTATVGGSLLTVDGDATVTNLTASSNVSASGNIIGFTGSFHSLQGDTSQGTALEVEGPITASGKIISDNIETFWTSFNIDGDASFGSSVYGPNTQGINYYHWNKNWSSTTSDSGNPTGDHVHRSEINSGWYVPYKLKIVELCGGFHDASAASTVAAKMALYNTAASLKDSDYDTNTGTTKEFIVSGSVTLNGNRWKHYSQTCDITLEEGQYVFPRITMGENLTNLRGQMTIKYKRV